MCRSVPIESKIGRGKKTLEGESPLLKDGALSLQTSLSLRELPPCPRRFRSENLFRFGKMAGSWGKFLSFWEVRKLCRVRLRARLVGGKRNDPYVVPFRLKVTCCSGLCLWWGDQSALTKSIHALRAPLTNRARSRTLYRPAPPNPPKTSLHGNRRPKNAENPLIPNRRLPCREVRGG